MARTRSYRSLKSEINIVPLLDVLLVLLLIFMATTPIITQSISVDIPHATDFNTIENTANALIIIEVSDVGKYTLIFEQKRMKQLSAERIVLEIKKYMASNPKSVLLIGGAKDVPYNEIIKALNFLRQAGVKSVGLMTQPI